ncbi:MAG TPA: hypothetical protein V6C78_16745 [Crinalium sp.]
MATLLEQLNISLDSSDLSSQIESQVGNLTGVVTTVTGLINNPPDSLGDLTQNLNALPLPDLNVGSDFTGTLSSLSQALPTDLSSITGGLTGTLQQLQNTIGTDLTGALGDALRAVLAIYNLTQIDFSCLGSADSGSSGSGSGGSGTPGGSGSPAVPGSQVTALTSSLDQVNGAIALLPSPLTVESFLIWLNDILNNPQRSVLLPLNIPVLDDLHDPLATLVSWQTMDEAAIQASLVQTVELTTTFVSSGIDDVLNPLDTALVALAAQVPFPILTQVLTDLTSGLTTLKTAVNSGNLSGTDATIASLNSLLDQYDAVRSPLQTNVLAQLPDLNQRLAHLPTDLRHQMEHVLSVLRPNGPISALKSLSTAATSANEAVLTEMNRWLGGLVGWLEDLVDMLDLSAIQEPLKAVADGARATVDGLDNAMVNVTLQVQNLFGEVQSLLGGANPGAIATQIEDSIQAFQSELLNQLAALFNPVRDAVHQVVDALSGAVDSFNPQAVIGTLTDALQAINSVLGSPEVVNAIAAIRSAMEAITQELQALSFAAVIDEVLQGIQDVIGILQGLDSSLLGGAMQGALQAALSVLPDDLSTITDPIIDQFGQFLDEGPVPVLESVKDQPKQLIDKVKEFEPTKLIGTELTQPYHDLVTQMDGFKPSSLLEPVQTELSKLKDRLKENVSPAQLLEPLEPLFNELLQAFDQLKPEELIAPLQATIDQVIDSIVNALPIDETFDQIDAALKQVAAVAGFGDKLNTVLQSATDLLNGFADPTTQLNTWLSPIFGKLNGLTDLTTLQSTLDNLSAALDKTKAQAVGDRVNTLLSLVLTDLNTLNPQSRLTTLVQAYRGITSQALAALPASPQKTALTNLLARCNPLQPAFNAPFQTLATWQQALTQTQTQLTSALTDWDTRFHTSDGILADLRRSSLTPTELVQSVQQALEAQLLEPLVKLFGLVHPVQQILDVFLGRLQHLVNQVKAKLLDLLLGPNSLTGIKDALQQLVQKLQNFDLSFLSDSLKDTFAQIRSQLDALNPAHLKDALESAFDALLQTLDLNQILPAADVAALDADYAAVVDKLKALDPQKLVTDVLQPEFEQTILPLLQSLDFADLITALIERLHNLDDELKAGIAQLNDAFVSMRQTVSSVGGGGGVSL